MTVKCPVCRGIRMDFEYPKHYDAYHKLIKEIYEILEDTDGWVEQECQDLVVERLKSLLEDKK